MLGYKVNNVFVNKDAKYTRSDHFVTGIEFAPGKASRITLERENLWI